MTYKEGAAGDIQKATDNPEKAAGRAEGDMKKQEEDNIALEPK